MPQMIQRRDWGAASPRSVSLLNPNELKGVAIHYTASDADEQADHRNCAARVRGIQSFHMRPESQGGRGWADIAYNFVVCKHGFAFEGRGFDVRSAGQGTNAGNDGYHAIVFLGDDTAGRDDVTDAGRRALGEIVRILHRRYPKATDVKPHSHFKDTSCPGDEIRAWIARKGWVVAPLPLHDGPWNIKVKQGLRWKVIGFGFFRHGSKVNLPFVDQIRDAARKHGRVLIEERPSS
jgi:hypothetical protein